MSVSMDGASAEIHDKIRDIPGTWGATLQAIEMAKSCGMRLQVNTTVMKSNLRDLADIFHLAKERGAVAWEVFFLIRTGRGLPSKTPSRGSARRSRTSSTMQRATASRCELRKDLISGESTSSARRAARRHEGNCTVTSRPGCGSSRGSRRIRPPLRINATGDGKGIIFIGHDGESLPERFPALVTGKRERRESEVDLHHSPPAGRDEEPGESQGTLRGV